MSTELNKVGFLRDGNRQKLTAEEFETEHREQWCTNSGSFPTLQLWKKVFYCEAHHREKQSNLQQFL